jgi:hypothetical protein
MKNDNRFMRDQPFRQQPMGPLPPPADGVAALMALPQTLLIEVAFDPITKQTACRVNRPENPILTAHVLASTTNQILSTVVDLQKKMLDKPAAAEEKA